MGLDLGTSGCKGVVLAETGEVVATARREYSLRRSRPGWVTLDPAIALAAVEELISLLARRAKRKGAVVRGVAFAVSGDEAIPLDRSGRVLYPCIMAPDTRSVVEGDELAAAVGPSRLHEITGLPPAPIHPLVRLMWFKRHRPRLFERVARFMSWEEFIAHRLGMEAPSSRSIAARTMAFDIRRNAWSEELLAAAGVDGDVFPAVVGSGTLLGELPRRVTARLELPAGAALVVGGLDQFVGALGAGCANPGTAMVGMGSWEAATILTREAPSNAGLIAGGYSVGPYVTPDRFAIMATSSGGGALVAWAAQLVAPGSSIAKLLARLPTRPSGLVVLPHFSGSYSPWLDADARGAIIGLSLDTGPGTVMRGILEGITFELRENLTRLADAGVPAAELRCTGGGARSSAWLQLRADILDRPVIRLNHVDTGAVGAACLAGASSGVFSTASDAVSRAVHPTDVFEPDERNAEEYRSTFGRYRALYLALRQIRRP
jgi:xylulokinase